MGDQRAVVRHLVVGNIIQLCMLGLLVAITVSAWTSENNVEVLKQKAEKTKVFEAVTDLGAEVERSLPRVHNLIAFLDGAAKTASAGNTTEHLADAARYAYDVMARVEAWLDRMGA